MNDEFELRNRLKNADTGKNAPDINESVVARAALVKKRGFTSFRVARLTMAAASLSVVGLAVSTLSLNLGNTSAPLFELAGSSSSPSSMNSDAARAEGSPMVSDKMIWHPVNYNYLTGELSDQTGRGTVYQAELVGDPIQILTSLANTFGVTGEPKLDEWSTPEFPSYSIQNENRSLGIYFSGTGSWYYSAWSNFSYGCPTSDDSGDTKDGASESEAAVEYCEPTPTPELIPTESQMVSRAQEIFGAMGITLDVSAARAYRDDWGSSISFPNVQNGIATGMDYYLGWGMDGELSYASGHSFRLVERGEFSTISALSAVARISDWRWFGGAPSSYYEDLAVTSDSTMGVTSREAVAPEKPFVEQEPSENSEPVVIDLLVTRAEVATLTVYDSQGNLWFVPGYLLFNDQGWFDAIISLEDGVISLPEPMDFGVMPYLPEPAVD